MCKRYFMFSLFPVSSGLCNCSFCLSWQQLVAMAAVGCCGNSLSIPWWCCVDDRCLVVNYFRCVCELRCGHYYCDCSPALENSQQYLVVVGLLDVCFLKFRFYLCRTLGDETCPLPAITCNNSMSSLLTSIEDLAQIFSIENVLIVTRFTDAGMLWKCILSKEFTLC